MLRNTIIKLFKQGHSRNLKTLLEKIHPADIALVLPNIDPESRKTLFEHYVTDKQAAKIISKLRDKKTVSDVLSGLKRTRISEIFKHIEPDDAAYLLNILSIKESDALLKLMKKDDAEEVNKILKFSQETAGGITNTYFISVREDYSLEQCLKELRKAKDRNNTSYIYVTDNEGVLKGSLRTKDIFKWPLETKVQDIIEHHPIYVAYNSSHAEVINTAYRYGLPEIPVVDKDKKVIGVVSSEHIFKIVKKETASDILIASGLMNIQELHKISTLNSIKIKIPIVLYAVILGLISVVATNYYLNNTGHQSIVIAFTPLILFVSYALANSSAAITLRELFFERANAADATSFRDVFTELRSGFFYSVIISAIVAFYSLSMLTRDTKDAALCSAGAFIACITSSFIGSLLSVLMVRLGIRPCRIPIALIIFTAVIVALIFFLWTTNYIYYTDVVPNSWTATRS